VIDNEQGTIVYQFMGSCHDIVPYAADRVKTNT